MLLGSHSDRSINRYSIWHYGVILAIILIAGIYALPNLFGEDYAVQVTAQNNQRLSASKVAQIERLLEAQGINYQTIELAQDRLLIRLNSGVDQLKTQQSLVESPLSNQFAVALNLAPATPNWLQNINAQPMYLGLDLRGGVYFLLELDIENVLETALLRQVSELKRLLRTENIGYEKVLESPTELTVRLRNDSDTDRAVEILEREFSNHSISIADTLKTIIIGHTEAQQRELQDFAIKQNLITLRNRVNELGVAEPVLQRQGANRIVVQLPGVQDTARAKEILGATATLEYRLVNQNHDPNQAVSRGFGPVGTRLYYTRDNQPILLDSEVIVTGENIINAQSGIDQETGSPMVSVTLDEVGGKRMLATTRNNIGQPMGVVFIQTRNEKRLQAGVIKKRRVKTEEVINVATIRGTFSNRFQTTGLDSAQEASDLALLLRAGSLAAAMEIVEERTIGPSLGRDNINQGLMSIIFGLCLVLVFMVFRYKVFGLFANVALVLNIVMILALLSVMQATLTLPGIAGILLTVGMAVDANVLVFERIREELAKGVSTPQAIHEGYSRAWVTIADANITTLIAAIILFGFGTGPIKGFAVTLSFGIVTSMFTAIIVTRSLVNFLYGGGKKRKTLPI